MREREEGREMIRNMEAGNSKLQGGLVVWNWRLRGASVPVCYKTRKNQSLRSRQNFLFLGWRSYGVVDVWVGRPVFLFYADFQLIG